MHVLIGVTPGSYNKGYTTQERTIVAPPRRGHEYRIVRTRHSKVTDDEDEEGGVDVPRVPVTAPTTPRHPFGCQVCARSFTSRKGLGHHYKTTMHLNAVKAASKRPRAEPEVAPPAKRRKVAEKKKEEEEEDGGYECDYCDETFGTSQGLANHRRGMAHVAKVAAAGKTTEEAQLARKRQVERRSRGKKKEEEEEEADEEVSVVETPSRLKAGPQDRGRVTGESSRSSSSDDEEGEKTPRLAERMLAAQQARDTDATPGTQPTLLPPARVPDPFAPYPGPHEIAITGHDVAYNVLHFTMVIKGLSSRISWALIADKPAFNPALRAYLEAHPDAKAAIEKHVQDHRK